MTVHSVGIQLDLPFVEIFNAKSGLQSKKIERKIIVQNGKSERKAMGKFAIFRKREPGN